MLVQGRTTVRGVLALGLGTVLMAGLVVFAQAPASAQLRTCRYENVWDTDVVFVDVTAPGPPVPWYRKLRVRTDVFYRYCRGSDGRRWVVPIHTNAIWRTANGGGISCLNTYDGVKFNFRIFATNGGSREVNPPQFKLGCDTDGSASRVTRLRRKRLYYNHGHAPRYFASVISVKRLGPDSREETHQNRLDHDGW